MTRRTLIIVPGLLGLAVAAVGLCGLRCPGRYDVLVGRTWTCSVDTGPVRALFYFWRIQGGQTWRSWAQWIGSLSRCGHATQLLDARYGGLADSVGALAADLRWGLLDLGYLPVRGRILGYGSFLLGRDVILCHRLVIPLWPTTVGCLLLSAMARGYRSYSRRRRRRFGRCEQCGYDLRGTPTEVCTECGCRVIGSSRPSTTTVTGGPSAQLALKLAARQRSCRNGMQAAGRTSSSFRDDESLRSAPSRCGSATLEQADNVIPA